jgi:hypothetical protein
MAQSIAQEFERSQAAAFEFHDRILREITQVLERNPAKCKRFAAELRDKINESRG